MSKRKKTGSHPISQSSPQAQALERFTPLLSAEQLAMLQAELERPLYSALRANPLKGEPESSLAVWSERYGWQLEPLGFCPTGRRVIHAQTPISQTIEHRLGFYYIQDAASMLPVELFDFDGLEQPLILDMAASPGGKTTHLVARTADRGLVIANDASADRLTALRLVLQTWGAVGTAMTRFPGEKFGIWFPETFDRVLLDAPCSMQGLRSTEGRRMRTVSDREQAELARRQKALLESALRAVKVGGQVVYSTCTLSPEEDEAVLDALLARHPGSFQIDNVSACMPAPAPALTEMGEHAFDPAVANALRLWPFTLGTAGFFAARLTKVAPLPVEHKEPPFRPPLRNAPEQLSRREQELLVDGFSERFGIHPQIITNDDQWSIWRRGDVFLLLPNLIETHFGGFPLEDAGLRIAERTPEGMVPSHEWAARFEGQFSAGIIEIPNQLAAGWCRGEDLAGSFGRINLVGQVVAVKDELGRYLGRGRVQSNRLRNLLPKRIVFIS